MTIELDVLGAKNRLLAISSDPKRSEQDRDKANFGAKLCSWFLDLLKLNEAREGTKPKSGVEEMMELLGTGKN